MTTEILVLAQTVTEEEAFVYAVVGAAIPIAFWLLFFYTRDRYSPEPKRLIAFLFFVGAVPAAIVAGIVNGLALSLAGPILGATLGLAVVAVIVAPVVEEVLKYGGARTVRRHRAFDEPVDGMIYGSTVGLGFAFTENIDYLVLGMTGIPISGDIYLCEPGLECFVTLVVGRGCGSALLHALATGIAGYFLAQHVLGKRTGQAERNGLRAAVAIHAAWNLAAFVAPALSLVVLAVAATVYTVLLRRALAASPHRVAQVDDRHHWVERFAVGDGTLQPCPACGFLHSATAHRCPVCAQQLLDGDVVHALACPSCGEPQPVTARFCSACGQRLPEATVRRR
jgi:protease PrsW